MLYFQILESMHISSRIILSDKYLLIMFDIIINFRELIIGDMLPAKYQLYD